MPAIGLLDCVLVNLSLTSPRNTNGGTRPHPDELRQTVSTRFT